MGHHSGELQPNAIAAEILNAAGDGFGALDEDLRFVYASPGAGKLFGKDDLLGKTPSGVIPGRAGKEVEAACRRAILQNEEIGYRQFDPAASRWYECRIYPSVRGVLLWVRDMTEWVRSEEQARIAEERFRLLVENIRDYAMLLLDPSGRVISWNIGAERILGYGENEIIGQPVSLIFTPEDREEGVPEKEMVKAIVEGRAEDERWHVRKDGTRFYATGILTALWDSNGELRGFSKILRDFTQRMRLQEALLQAQKRESIGVLAAGIAHDFNNLLTRVLGSASLIMDQLARDDANRPFAESIVTAAERASSLTRQLLAYSGQGKFWIQPVDLSSAVTDILELLHAALPEKVELKLELARDLDPIESDPTQMQQLVLNLVTNAAEAIEAGKGGVVTIRTESQYLDQHYLTTHFPGEKLVPGKFVSLEVIDTGTGMNEDVMSKMFDPFFSTKFTGRGLGLAAVAGIVRSHHGAVWVRSTPGKGTGFRVLLPTAALALQPDQAPAAEAQRPPIATLLVAEDEPLVARAAQEMLEWGGYRVLVADTGTELFRIMERHSGRISLVLLDLTLSGMGADELLAALRERFPEVRVVLTGGPAEAEAATQAEGFVQKPYTATRLLAAIEAALNRRSEGGGA